MYIIFWYNVIKYILLLREKSMTLKVNNNRSTEDKKKDLKNKLSQSIENTGDSLMTLL